MLPSVGFFVFQAAHGPICYTAAVVEMERLIIDGSVGEGGGQVLRTCLSLSALTGRPFELYNIRARRSTPGLRPQHLTAVWATAATCAAELRGAAIHSQLLSFTPRSAPQAGEYIFDVQEAARGGSAGSVTLILQTLLWPLLFSAGTSRVTLRGGTHVAYSPPYPYLAEVARPAFHSLGARFTIALLKWGWYPQGQGEMQATIEPLNSLHGTSYVYEDVEEVIGLAAATNLPAHIPQRMSQRAASLLYSAGLRARVTPLRASAPAAGAGVFLWVPQAGFSALGRRGLPAEEVAASAVAQCLAFIENRAAVDPFLADQLLLPAALAEGHSAFTTSRLTQHTLTNAGLLRQWLGVTIEIDGRQDEPAQITVHGVGFRR